MIIDMEISKDTQEFSKEEIALITKMFYDMAAGKPTSSDVG